MPRTVIVKTDTTLRALGPTLLDARFRGEQVETALDRLKGIGDAVQFGVLRGIFPDPARRMFAVGIPGFKASIMRCSA